MKYENGERIPFLGAEKMDVETVRVRCALEDGGKRNQSIHAHIVLEIGHRTMVQLDKAGLEARISTSCPSPLIALNTLSGHIAAFSISLPMSMLCGIFGYSCVLW